MTEATVGTCICEVSDGCCGVRGYTRHMNESFHRYYSMEVIGCNRGVYTVRASWGTGQHSAGALGWDVHIGVKIRKVFGRNRIITVAQGAQW